MEKNWITLFQQQNQPENVFKLNETTHRYGLSLSEQEAQLIISERNRTLQECRRVEIGTSITEKIILEFCDSDFLYQSNYVDSIIRLQDIFFAYKNEIPEEVTDEELLHFMKEQFDTVCFGDLDYLETTCLDDFARAVRSGYNGYHSSDGRGIYRHFDSVTRWDKELYFQALNNLF